MSQPPAPSLGAGTAAVWRLQHRRLVRGKKVRLGALAIVLVLIAVIVARYAQDTVDAPAVMSAGIRLGFFTLLVYLIPFLVTSGAIAEEVESRTFAYLSSRPITRLSITLGKYMAGMTAALTLLVGGVLIMHLGVFLTDPSGMIDELPSTLRAAGAIALLALVYGAVCTFWGAVATEAAGIVSALWLVIVEFTFGLLPGIFRFVSMNHHATVLAGQPKGGLLPQSVPEMSVWIAPTAMVGEMIVFLMLAALIVNVSEYRFGKA